VGRLDFVDGDDFPFDGIAAGDFVKLTVGGIGNLDAPFIADGDFVVGALAGFLVGTCRGIGLVNNIVIVAKF
jgi:hypothetical protein